MSDLIDRQALKDYVSSLSTHPSDSTYIRYWMPLPEPPKEKGE